MMTFTITEQIKGYTYITACDADTGVSADYIISDCSTTEDWDISAELDTISGFEPDYILQIWGWSADGYLSIAKAQEGIEYHFKQMVKHYREGWLGL